MESTLNGEAIKKRDGYSRTATLTVTTSPVSGSTSFVDPNGNLQTIVCHDHYCAKSTNGAGFSVWLSTGGNASNCMPTRWSFVQINGKLYGANDCRDPILQYDGTTLSYPTTMPKGAILELTKDRLVVADVASSPNSVYYSQSGTYTNFTTGLNSSDPYVDPIGAPGDRVSALKFALGRLYIFKTTSITACILKDQYASSCYPVSNAIGTKEPLSVVEIPGAILFRGQTGAYWAINSDGSLTLISKPISNLVSTQNTGSTQSNTQTSQADWQLGTQTPAGSWDTSSVAGSVIPSSTTISDSGIFGNGTLSKISSTSLSVGLAITTNTIGQGNFAPSGEWTTENAFSYVHFYANQSNGSNITFNSMTIPVNCPNGTSTCGGFLYWTSGANPYCNTSVDEIVDIYNGDTYNGGTSGTPVRTDPWTNLQTPVCLSNTTNLTSVQTGTAPIYNIQTSTSVFLCFGLGAGNPCTNNLYGDLKTVHATPSGFSLSIDAVGQATNGSGGTTVGIWFSGIRISSYSATGTYISPTFDTGFSTPIIGAFNVSQSSNSTSAITYKEAYSSDQVSWSTTTINPGSDAIGKKRYWRYEADFTTSNGTMTATDSGASLQVATTGQFQTQCIPVGSQVSAWGQLSCAQSTVGAGSLVYYATSAVSCAAIPSTPPTSWTSVSNNATLSIGVSSAVVIGFRSLLGSATDQAQVDACTLYWSNGVTSPPAWATYDITRNAVFWTTAINNSASNNRVLKYDLNLNQWYPFNLNANAINTVQNQTYFGDSTGGYWNQYGGVNSDNGSAINAYWKSKDFSGGVPFQDKSLNRISLVAKNETTGNMTVTYGLSNNTSGSYTVSLSTTTGATYVHANRSMSLLSPFQFLNVKLGNNSATPFEIDGAQLDTSVWPWRSANP